MSRPRRARRWPLNFWETAFAVWMVAIVVVAILQIVLENR